MLLQGVQPGHVGDQSDLIVLRIVPAFNKVIFLQGVQPSHVGDHSPRERKTRSETDTGEK